MVKMKNRYGKTGLMMAVLALISVLSAPTAMADRAETVGATYEHPNIVVTAGSFKQADYWYQVRCYQPGSNPGIGAYPSNSGGYLTSAAWVPDTPGDGIPLEDPHTCSIDVSGLPDGTWTAYLFKDGGYKSPPKKITSMVVYDTVDVPTVDVPIPEFATIAIPIVALLGLVALYRRKQKK